MPPEVIDADGHIVERDAGLRAHLAEPFSKRRGSLVPSDGMDTSMGGAPGRDGKQRRPDPPPRHGPRGDRRLGPVPDQQLRHDPDHRTRLRGGLRQRLQRPRRGGLRREPASAGCRAPPVSGPSRRRSARRVAPSSTSDSPASLSPRRGCENTSARKPTGPSTRSSSVSACRCASTIGARARQAISDSTASCICTPSDGPSRPVIQFVGLVYGGVAERFPSLRIGFMECGAGWAPYWMERMDEEWEKRGSVEAPLCKEKPSSYVLSRPWYFAVEPDEGMLPYCIDRIGADRILFASDYPHWDGMFPNVVSTIRSREDISVEAKEMILGGNANRFYGWNEE